MEESFYDLLQERILLDRDIIRSLISQPKLQGDYYEALVRDLLTQYTPFHVKVKRGIVKGEEWISRETDAVFYDNARVPLFQTSDLCIISSRDCSGIVEIKGYLASDSLKSTIKAFREIKNPDISYGYFFFAFNHH